MSLAIDCQHMAHKQLSAVALSILLGADIGLPRRPASCGPVPIGLSVLPMASTYKGPERRRYHVLVCENVEFHLRDNRCIAVKNRHTGLWATGHAAAGSAIVDGPAKALQVGDSVRFTQDNATYRISGIERPSHYKAGTEPPGLADESAG